MKKLSDHPAEDIARTELSHLVLEYIKTLQVERPFRYRCDHESGPERSQIYYVEGLVMLLEASVVLQDGELFANALRKDPAAIPQHVFRTIGQGLNDTSIAFFQNG